MGCDLNLSFTGNFSAHKNCSFQISGFTFSHKYLFISNRQLYYLVKTKKRQGSSSMSAAGRQPWEEPRFVGCSALLLILYICFLLLPVLCADSFLDCHIWVSLYAWDCHPLFQGKEVSSSVESLTSLSDEISPFLIICAMYLEMKRLCKYWTTLFISRYLPIMQLVTAGNLLGQVVQFISRKPHE